MFKRNGKKESSQLPAQPLLTTSKVYGVTQSERSALALALTLFSNQCKTLALEPTTTTQYSDLLARNSRLYDLWSERLRAGCGIKAD